MASRVVKAAKQTRSDKSKFQLQISRLPRKEINIMLEKETKPLTCLEVKAIDHTVIFMKKSSKKRQKSQNTRGSASWTRRYYQEALSEDGQNIKVLFDSFHFQLFRGKPLKHEGRGGGRSSCALQRIFALPGFTLALKFS